MAAAYNATDGMPWKSPADRARQQRLLAFTVHDHHSRIRQAMAVISRSILAHPSGRSSRGRQACAHRPFQLSCAWRKRKNSRPSRRRRFIISQLTIISLTISQIFDGRK